MRAAPGTVRAWSYVAVVAVLTVVLTTASSAATSWWGRRAGQLDLVTSAQPARATPTVDDEASRLVWVPRDEVKTDAVATASVECAGCHGDARTVQVVDARSSAALRADNVATAWSRCTDCGATAVSVQLVVAARSTEVTANNRALAVNAACSRCGTAAAAYQLVVVAPGSVDLRGLRAQLRAWVRVHGAVPAPPPAVHPRSKAPGSRPDTSARLDELAALVTEQTHGHVVRRSADARRGR